MKKQTRKPAMILATLLVSSQVLLAAPQVFADETNSTTSSPLQQAVLPQRQPLPTVKQVPLTAVQIVCKSMPWRSEMP